MCNLKDNNKTVTKKFPRTLCNGCRKLINPDVEITASLFYVHHDIWTKASNSYIRCHVYMPIIEGNSDGRTGYCSCNFRYWYLFEYCDDNITDDNTFKTDEVISENEISL